MNPIIKKIISIDAFNVVSLWSDGKKRETDFYKFFKDQDGKYLSEFDWLQLDVFNSIRIINGLIVFKVYSKILQSEDSSIKIKVYSSQETEDEELKLTISSSDILSKSIVI